MDNKLLEYCEEIETTHTAFPDLQCRNIVGRAYYYTYHEAKYHLEERLGWEQTSEKGGVHARLFSRLQGYESQEQEEIKMKAELIYTKINALKKLRTRADYKMESVISKELARFSIADAKRISELLAEV
ncbi:hypothetical protein [Acinetobacter proteolyticus]|uniref:hypothetical protein n=1 Tax=Acinetobacter proteolyticus TaxID=1776741 RepID=UPI003D97FD2C